jgi:hypothetical protein
MIEFVVPGKNYYVETVLGSYLIEAVQEILPNAVVGKRNVYVGNTGRHHLFFQGINDEYTELEVHPPEILRKHIHCY